MYRKPIKSKTKNKSARKGFTLVEMVAASALLIAAMVPILQVLTGTLLYASIIERRTGSLIAAKNVIEQCKALSISDWDEINDGNNINSSGKYFYNIDVTEEQDDLKKIVVQAGYDMDGNGSLSSDEIQVTLATFISRRD